MPSPVVPVSLLDFLFLLGAGVPRAACGVDGAWTGWEGKLKDGQGYK